MLEEEEIELVALQSAQGNAEGVVVLEEAEFVAAGSMEIAEEVVVVVVDQSSQTGVGVLELVVDTLLLLVDDELTVEAVIGPIAPDDVVVLDNDEDWLLVDVDVK